MVVLQHRVVVVQVRHGVVRADEEGVVAARVAHVVGDGGHDAQRLVLDAQVVEQIRVLGQAHPLLRDHRAVYLVVVRHVPVHALQLAQEPHHGRFVHVAQRQVPTQEAAPNRHEASGRLLEVAEYVEVPVGGERVVVHRVYVAHVHRGHPLRRSGRHQRRAPYHAAGCRHLELQRHVLRAQPVLGAHKVGVHDLYLLLAHLVLPVAQAVQVLAGAQLAHAVFEQLAQFGEVAPALRAVELDSGLHVLQQIHALVDAVVQPLRDRHERRLLAVNVLRLRRLQVVGQPGQKQPPQLELGAARQPEAHCRQGDVGDCPEQPDGA
ncbi:glycoside hydrolase family 30 protein [Babesia caballi]|uniref:Glycoside hydrolase family 30 protein n=1 Tax=Babesia caballi TaxID=5871 RepID=A0AAV4M0J2_BABCB|nr:glycoside hydrolase family 30 protein [Babesia caballi]